MPASQTPAARPRRSSGAADARDPGRCGEGSESRHLTLLCEHVRPWGCLQEAAQWEAAEQLSS
ncbi:hypothetical protein HaLaN_28164 [Haematococcus lacustris]|uniref:Uncharacterized protein n=1 Tax=Haematococcus lacustris TaxID=44745 RepID=A0A6A0ABR8_HAELA|nr:hypothetical protein HaLaN_28164 [Haematococcus lacustris]